MLDDWAIYVQFSTGEKTFLLHGAHTKLKPYLSNG
jgi:hypothetical protein